MLEYHVTTEIEKRLISSWKYDGDYALACSEGTFGGVPTTYYDLFRVENGFIAEHWDVMETYTR
nr:hypothetical protein [uncultured Butyrivibrio sp.]